MFEEQSNPRRPLEGAAGSTNQNRLPDAEQQNINEPPRGGVQAHAELGPQEHDDNDEADDDDTSSQAPTLVSGEGGRRNRVAAAIRGAGRGQAIGGLAGISRASNTNVNSKLTARVLSPCADNHPQQ